MLRKMIGTMLLLTASWVGGYAHVLNNTPETTQFIDRYSSIAVAEMMRSGVPASITLAQAILESGWGKTDLAMYANNFFGIKCKPDWEGGRHYKVDDDTDEAGNPVASCFRTYHSIEASFIDHTDFLLERPYYQKCFEYQSHQYVEWAIALQDANYATADDYAYRLVELIETHDLMRFDLKPSYTRKVNATPEPRITPFVTLPMESEAVEQVVVEKIVAPNSSTVRPNELVLPPAEHIGIDYVPEWKKAQNTARSPQPQMPHKNTSSASPKNTYQKHIRTMPYTPKANGNRRR